MSHFILDKKTKKILNSVMIRKIEEFPLDKDCELVEANPQNIGDTYVKGYTPPEPIIPYAEKRAEEYPPIGDQLDAIWKEFNTRRLNGEALTQEADDMLGKILAVKKKYPKGE